jgi:type 1 glutamine amidotransferase
MNRSGYELYHRLVPMHGVSYRVLATAYSSAEKGGTGRHEPVLITTQYGAGRVFYLSLGHVWPLKEIEKLYIGNTLIAFESRGFQRLLARGCEWVATGDVKP